MSFKVNSFASVMPIYIRWQESTDGYEKENSDIFFVDFLSKKVIGLGGLVMPDELSAAIFRAINEGRSIPVSTNMEQVDKLIQAVMGREQKISKEVEKFSKTTQSKTAQAKEKKESEDDRSV